MDQVNQNALEELEKYKKAGAHMLVPCMSHIADVAQGFRVIVTPVALSPHPKDKDVYPHEPGHYDQYKNEWKPETGEGTYKKKFNPDVEMVRISGQGLEKLSQNANIQWSQPQIEVDRESQKRQVAYITGALRMPDGFSFYRVPDLYGMDLDIEMEKIQATYAKQAKEGKDPQWMIDRDYLQKKVNQKKLCISGAKNRVIRKILGLSNTYTVAQLSKEFVMVRVIPWLDMNDEYTRRLVIQSNVAQMTIANLYGGQQPNHQTQQVEEAHKPAIEYVGEVSADKCRNDDDVIDAETSNGATHYIVNSDAPPFAMDQPPTTSESLRADFLNSEVPEQCKALDRLAQQKGFDTTAWLGKFKPTTTLEALKPDLKISLYDHLCGLVEKAGVAA